MEITVSHRFDRPFAAVWAMALNPEAHLAKYRHMGHREVELLRSEAGEGSLDICIVRKVEVEVPAIARKVITPVNTVTSDDRWELESDTVGVGRSDVTIKGVPVASVGTARVEADGDGCTWTTTLALTIKVPVVGDRIARAMRGQLEDQLRAEVAASEAWLAEHP